jgi:hypothetical protein
VEAATAAANTAAANATDLIAAVPVERITENKILGVEVWNTGAGSTYDKGTTHMVLKYVGAAVPGNAGLFINLDNDRFEFTGADARTTKGAALNGDGRQLALNGNAARRARPDTRLAPYTFIGNDSDRHKTFPSINYER